VQLDTRKDGKAVLMEKLLDIKDAAALLKVSEMTIRRWTNAGKLKCYRVGGKRERRFHMGDLEAFLQGPSEHELKPLGLGNQSVPDGSHMTHFYSGKEEALGVSVPYVIEGFKQGEVVLVVMPPERSRALLANLERQGHSVEMRLKSGWLHLSEGMDSPEQMIRYLAGHVEKAGQFRLVGDGVWAIRKGWDSAAIRTLEEAGNALRSREGKLFLCQYSLEDFSGSDIMMAAELHEQIIYKGRLGKSPYYLHEK
jgi:transcriptional repressor of dcmA and dcmR